MLKLAPLFTDHCVLPRDKELRIFGTCDGADTVTVTLTGGTGCVLSGGVGQCGTGASWRCSLLSAPARRG